MSTICYFQLCRPLLFTQLVRRLRQTNARYHHIASQCRHTRRPTHHAKRRARRAGLRVDTSKARAVCVDNVSQIADSDESTRLLSALSAFALGETGAGNEQEENQANIEEDGLKNGCVPGLGLKLRNLPEVVVQKQGAHDLEAYSIPLFQGPVPGAPRWKSRPLPEEDAKPTWQGATAAHALDLESAAADMVCGGSGATVPPPLLMRKVDENTGGVVSRQPEVGVVDEGTWSESQKRRRGL